MTTALTNIRFSRGATGVAVSAVVFLILYALMIGASPIAGTQVLVSSFITLTAPLALAAAGTTLVLIVGGFDLSVAGTISLTNVIAATTMEGRGGSVWLIAILVLLLGAAIGLINGFFVAILGLPALGVTLGSNIILAGAALMILPAPGGTVPAQFTDTLTATVSFFPVAGAVLLAVALIWLLYSRSRTGMATFAVGGDIASSRLSGIPVARVQMTNYALAGVLYAGAGLYFSAITGTGSPASGTSFLLTAFAAAALGLVSFTGGRGSVIAAMFGAAILTVIPKLLFAAGVADFWVGAVQGLVVIIALCIPATAYALARRPKSRSSQPGAPPATPSEPSVASAPAPQLANSTKETAS